MITHASRRPRLAVASLLLLAASALGSQAIAEPYPTGVVRIVAPFGAGTPPDIVSRLIAAELSESEGWKVVVENKPGAVTTMAGNDVLKQAADGQTVYAMALPVASAPALLPNIPYQLETDFAPIIKISTSYNVLVVNPAVPAKTVAELVAILKSQPDKLNFSSGGFGTPAHLIGEMFKLQTGVRAAHVAYQQFPQAISDLLNGTNQYMFITSLPVVDLIAAGKLRALAVTSPKRIAALEDIPTVVEQGFPSLMIADWVGFAVKTGTPNNAVVRLNGAINKARAGSPAAGKPSLVASANFQGSSRVRPTAERASAGAGMGRARASTTSHARDNLQSIGKPTAGRNSIACRRPRKLHATSSGGCRLLRAFP